MKMALERWRPLREIEGMRREMDRIWDEIFPAATEPFAGAAWSRAATESRSRERSPAIDIVEKDDEIIVRAEMPGVPREEIDVSVSDGLLSVRGRIKASSEAADGDCYYSERNYTSYARSIKMPLKAAPEKITASLADGILSIRLPKTDEARERKIEIE